MLQQVTAEVKPRLAAQVNTEKQKLENADNKKFEPKRNSIF